MSISLATLSILAELLLAGGGHAVEGLAELLWLLPDVPDGVASLLQLLQLSKPNIQAGAGPRHTAAHIARAWATTGGRSEACRSKWFRVSHPLCQLAGQHMSDKHLVIRLDIMVTMDMVTYTIWAPLLPLVSKLECRFGWNLL